MSEPAPLPPVAHWQTAESLQRAIDGLPDPYFVKDLNHRFVICNQALATMMNRQHAEIIGKRDADFFPAEQAALFVQGDLEVQATRQVIMVEEELTNTDGTTLTIWTRKSPVFDAQGAVVAVSGVITDITHIRRRQRRVEQLEADIVAKAEIIQTQTSLLDQLGAPVIKVGHGIMLMPLVGSIDDTRAGRVMETMLEAIGRDAAEIIIVDITGVPVVDTSVASYLIRSVRAAQLLGCQTLLVGISGEIAQTLVGLGVDFGSIITRATLETGLEYAYRLLNFELRPRTVATAPAATSPVPR